MMMTLITTRERERERERERGNMLKQWKKKALVFVFVII